MVNSWFQNFLKQVRLQSDFKMNDSAKPIDPKTLKEIRVKILESRDAFEALSNEVNECAKMPIIYEDLKQRYKKLIQINYIIRQQYNRVTVHKDLQARKQKFIEMLNQGLLILSTRKEAAKLDVNASDTSIHQSSNLEIKNELAPTKSVTECISTVDTLLLNKNPADEIMRAAGKEAVTAMSESVKKFGFNEETQSLAKKTSLLVLKLVDKNPNLSKTISQSNEVTSQYIASHSLLLGETLVGMAHRIGWTSPGTYLRLVLASLIHDLTLSNDKLAKIRDLNTPGLTNNEKNEILEHPKKSAELVLKFKEIPADLEKIILEHHENNDGTGFPNQLTHTQIQPLSCLFIIGHDFLDFYLDNPEKSTFEEFCKLRANKYTHGNFKKIFNALVSGSQME